MPPTRAADGPLDKRVVFLDLDETLLDFRRAEPLAFAAALARFGTRVDDALFARYAEVNRELWAMHERGEMDSTTLKTERFRRFRDLAGLKAGAEELSAAFVEELSMRSWPLPGANELCAHLARGRVLVVVSNGLRDVQLPRVAAAPFARHVAAVVVSEDVGFGKPDPRIFAKAFEAAGFCPVRDRSAAVMIGDSLASDIKGGADFGIDTIWFNPRGLRNPGPVSPAREVSSLEEIRFLLR